MSETVFILLKWIVSSIVTNPLNGELKINGGNRDKQAELKYVDAIGKKITAGFDESVFNATSLCKLHRKLNLNSVKYNTKI